MLYEVITDGPPGRTAGDQNAEGDGSPSGTDIDPIARFQAQFGRVVGVAAAVVGVVPVAAGGVVLALALASLLWVRAPGRVPVRQPLEACRWLV